MSHPLADMLFPGFNGPLTAMKYIQGGLHSFSSTSQRNNNLPFLTRSLDGVETTLAYVTTTNTWYRLINNPATDATADGDWAALSFSALTGPIPIGDWDPNTNSPTLADAGAVGINGQFYYVINADAGFDFTALGLFGGNPTTVFTGDWVISIGSSWAIIPGPNRSAVIASGSGTHYNPVTHAVDWGGVLTDNVYIDDGYDISFGENIPIHTFRVNAVQGTEEAVMSFRLENAGTWGAQITHVVTNPGYGGTGSSYVSSYGVGGEYAEVGGYTSSSFGIGAGQANIGAFSMDGVSAVQAIVYADSGGGTADAFAAIQANGAHSVSAGHISGGTGEGVEISTGDTYGGSASPRLWIDGTGSAQWYVPDLQHVIIGNTGPSSAHLDFFCNASGSLGVAKFLATNTGVNNRVEFQITAEDFGSGYGSSFGVAIIHGSIVKQFFMSDAQNTIFKIGGDAKGDIFYQSGAIELTILPIGTLNQVLTVSAGGIPSWATPVAGFTNPMTTAGDIIYENATPVPARLAIGTAGQVLTVTGGFPVWTTPVTGFANPMTTLGDIIYENATPVPTRLAGNITTTVKYLQQTGNGSISAAPTWSQVGLTTGVTGVLPSANGGTGVANASNITIGGALTFSGAFATTFTVTNTTTLTLPTTGTLVANPMTTAGDLIYGGVSGLPTRLAATTDGFVLTLTAGNPVWAASSGGSALYALNPQGGSYTFVLSDATTSTLVQATSASNTNHTVPPNASVAYSVGAVLNLVWDGTGTPSWLAGAGVTLNSSSGNLALPARYAVSTAVKTATNTWYVWNGLPGNPFSDAIGLVMNASDNTKVAVFSAAAIATATTRTYTLQDASGTLYQSGGTDIAVADGGTNFSSYAVGDILQASAAATLSKLVAVATGNVIISGGVGTISSWGKVGLTTHVSGVLPLANGGTNAALTDPGAHTVMGWDDTTNAVRFFILGTGLTYTQGTNTLSVSITSITNTAAANEIPKSNGTNIVPSGVFSTTLGDLTLGTSLAGSARTITADGSATDVGLTHATKGAGLHRLNTGAGGSTVLTNGTYSIQIAAQSGAFIQASKPSGTGNFSIIASNGISGATTGDDMIVQAGAGFGTGATNGGNIYLKPGLKNSSGLTGNIAFATGTATWGGGERVIFYEDAVTNPTTNPTGGGIMFVKSSDHKPYWRTPAGVETVMLSTGGISNSAASNEMMKSDGTNAIGSKLFSAANGDFTMGDSGLAGNRTLTATNSTSNATLSIVAQGSVTIDGGGPSSNLNVSMGKIVLGSASHAGVARTIEAQSSGGNTSLILQAAGTGDVTLSVSATSGRGVSIVVQGASGNARLTSYNGAILELSGYDASGGGSGILVRGGDSTALNASGGSVEIRSGAPSGSGVETSVNIQTRVAGKIGFWNVAGIIRPTTAGAAATFVANTSLIANDTATWDGYTAGQVVKALRNIGLLT